MNHADWIGLLAFIAGALWALPAWFLGKASGMQEIRRIRMEKIIRGFK
jgi:hypothetical protein